MEKWLSFGTGMYDMTVFKERDEKARRLIAGGRRIRELEAAGDGFIVGRGEGIGNAEIGYPRHVFPPAARASSGPLNIRVGGSAKCEASLG